MVHPNLSDWDKNWPGPQSKASLLLREMVTGRYTDVLVKEGGRWLFITWAGGDDPKKQRAGGPAPFF